LSKKPGIYSRLVRYLNYEAKETRNVFEWNRGRMRNCDSTTLDTEKKPGKTIDFVSLVKLYVKETRRLNISCSRMDYFEKSNPENRRSPPRSVCDDAPSFPTLEATASRPTPGSIPSDNRKAARLVLEA